MSHRSRMRCLALFFVVSCLAFAARADDPARLVGEIDRLLTAAIGARTANYLGDYAAQAGAAAERFEPFTEAARRILAGSPATRQAPDITALQLEQLAARVLAASPTPAQAIAAHQARFQARRIIAAMHYNLFKRSLKLAELVAATYREKDAVLVWRELVALAEQHRVPEASRLRAELKHFEASLKELEEQCCPPDEAILKQPVWQPAKTLP